MKAFLSNWDTNFNALQHGIIDLFSVLVKATNLRAPSHRVGWCGPLANYAGTHQRGESVCAGWRIVSTGLPQWELWLETKWVVRWTGLLQETDLFGVIGSWTGMKRKSYRLNCLNCITMHMQCIHGRFIYKLSITIACDNFLPGPGEQRLSWDFARLSSEYLGVPSVPVLDTLEDTK